jgi:hypothetical protein
MKPVGLRTLLLIAWAAASAAGEPPNPWTYDGSFHRTISTADRIVVRDGGFNCCGPVGDQKVLFEVTDAREIKEVYEHIQFKSPQIPNACMCCGYPGIDWYQGEKRLALTSVQHGRALRWRGFGFPRDAQFTEDFAQWLGKWFLRHGVTRPVEEANPEIREARMEQQQKEARQALAKTMPAGFLEAVKRGKAEATRQLESFREIGQLSAIESEGDLKDRQIRASIADRKSLYSALFRVLGCLPMRWDALYAPEQQEAFEFLIRAPRDELDQAIRAAVESKDKAEKVGAARLVFSQTIMTAYGKTEVDIVAWVNLLAAAAYADSIPENRRIVLHRLIEYPKVKATDILEQAAGDPDLDVRLKAVVALRGRSGPEAIAILQRIVDGKIHARTPAANLTDYAEGIARSLSFLDRQEGTEWDTEQEGAAEALRVLAR